MEEIKWYFDQQSMVQEILSIYNEVISDFSETQEEADYLHEEYSQEYLEERAEFLVEKWNKDMRNLLINDESIPCNLVGNYRIHSRMDWDEYQAMINRLESGEDTPQTKADRENISAWFWYAVGTYNFTYNFQNEVSEALCHMPEAENA